MKDFRAFKSKWSHFWRSSAQRVALLVGTALFLIALPTGGYAAPPKQGDSLADVRYQQGLAYYHQGDIVKARDLFEEAQVLYREAGNSAGEVTAQEALARAALAIGDYDTAQVASRQALALWMRTENRIGQGHSYFSLGVAYYGSSQLRQALAYLQIALGIFQEWGDAASTAEVEAWITFVNGEQTVRPPLPAPLPSIPITVQGLTPTPGTALVAQADALLAEGGALYQKSDFRGALEKLQQALLLYEQTNVPMGQAITLWLVGRAHDQMFEYEQALAYYAQALLLWRELHEWVGEVETLNNIGAIYHRLGKHEDALIALKQALDIARSNKGRSEEAETLNRIGAVHHSLSGYEDALAAYEQALVISREVGDQVGEATVLNNIGLVYGYTSDHTQALASFEEALSILREVGDWIGESTTLNNIGVVYNRLGKYEEALVCLEKALSILQTHGDWTREATVLNSIGTVYDHLGEYEQALMYYESALAIHRRTRNRREEAITLSNISLIYHRCGEHMDALTFYKQALATFHSSDNLFDEATTLSSLATVYHALSNYEQALNYFQQALDIRQEIGDQYGEATTLNNIGGVYDTFSDYGQALNYFQQALDIRREIGDRAGEAITLENLASAYEGQGQEEQALEYMLQVIVVLESIHGELKLEAPQTAFAASTASSYHHTIRLLLAQGREAEAFHCAERGRARAFLTILGNQRVDPKGSEAPALIQREAQLRGELATLERQLQEELNKPKDQQSEQVFVHITANLEDRHQEYENLLTRLQLTNPEYATLVSVDPLALEEAQSLLREQVPDFTPVAYFVGDAETIVFVVGPDTFHTQAVSVTRQELRQQGEALLAEMNAKPMQPQYWQVPAQALREWLIAPVQDYLPPANSDAPPRLGIIPHDLLHYLPFDLLYNGKGILLEGYTLFYTPSVSSLRFIFEKRHPQADTLLAFANPDVPGAPHLRYAEEEAWAVATLYETQPLTGMEATESCFKAQAGEHSLVHLAAHSDYNPRSPLFSAILLTGDENEDGRLETHEVFNLDLPQTDLVVLSACQTHIGVLSSGDELVGLERAFVRAGSPSLLTTLWPVDDAATADLMKRFYTRLRAGVPKAEALRLAQIETQAEHPEPYYWAGFVLVGDAGMPSEAVPTKATATPQLVPVRATPTPQPTPIKGKGDGKLCGGAAMLLGMVGAVRWRRRRRGSCGKGGG